MSAPACPPHHWRIATPNGPTSAGICVQCGDERTFANYEDTTDWSRFVNVPRSAYDPDLQPIAEVNDLSDVWGGRR